MKIKKSIIFLVTILFSQFSSATNDKHQKLCGGLLGSPHLLYQAIKDITKEQRGEFLTPTVSGNGLWLATSYAENEKHVVQVAKIEGKKIKPFRMLPDAKNRHPQFTHFSHTGNRLITFFADEPQSNFNEFDVWDVDTHKVIYSSTTDWAETPELKLSPGGRFLMFRNNTRKVEINLGKPKGERVKISNNDSAPIVVIDLESGQEIQLKKIKIPGSQDHLPSIQATAFLSENEIMVAFDGTLLPQVYEITASGINLKTQFKDRANRKSIETIINSMEPGWNTYTPNGIAVDYESGDVVVFGRVHQTLAKQEDRSGRTRVLKELDYNVFSVWNARTGMIEKVYSPNVQVYDFQQPTVSIPKGNPEKMNANQRASFNLALKAFIQTYAAGFTSYGVLRRDKNGRRILSVQMTGFSGNSIQSFDLTSNVEMPTIPPHQLGYGNIASPGSNQLITTGQDARAILWNFELPD